MNYFNGFLMKGEEGLFRDILPIGDTVVAGFSMGAIRAFEFALESSSRIDRIILLSPAFFNDKDNEFIEKQLHAWSSGSQIYSRIFLKNCAYPSNMDLGPVLAEGNIRELEFLLRYRWEAEKIEYLLSRGIQIEIFLGMKDKIINSKAALDFFSSFDLLCYLFREAGHMLQPVLKNRRYRDG